MQEVIIKGEFQLNESLNPERETEVLEEIKEVFNITSLEEEEQCHYYRFLCITPEVKTDEIKRVFIDFREDILIANIEMWFLNEPGFKFSFNGKEISYKMKV